MSVSQLEKAMANLRIGLAEMENKEAQLDAQISQFRQQLRRVPRQAMYGQKVPNLTGGTAVMNVNHHLSKPVLIGEIQDDGMIETVWSTEGEVPGDAWSDFIPESAKLTADWTYPWVCGNCEAPTYALN